MQSVQAQAEAIANLYTPPDTGRPSDIGDAHVLKELLTAIEDGNYLRTACDLAGLSHVTVGNWLKRGEAGETPYDRFVTVLKRAEARAEAKMVANVRKASDLPQFWAAAATHLERRHPERWGKRQDDTQTPRVVVQIGGPADVKIAFAVTNTHSVLSSPLEAKVEGDANSLNDKAFAELSSPISAVMLQPAEGAEAATIRDREIPAVEPRGGPYPGEAEAPQRARGVVRQRTHSGGRQRKKGVPGA